MISAETPVVLVKNECVMVAETNCYRLFDYLEVAEFSAKSLILSTSLGQMIPISDDQVEELGKSNGPVEKLPNGKYNQMVISVR